MTNLQWPLVIIGCFALLVSRTVSIVLVSLVVNCFRKEPIPFSHQIVMSYGGLRGAVAFYLSLNINTEYKHLIIMTTMCLILFTIVGLGSTTTFLLKYLDSRFPQDEIIKKDSVPEDQSPLDEDGRGNFQDPTVIENLDKQFAQHMFRRSRAPGEEDEIRVNLGLDDDLQSVMSGTTNQDKSEIMGFFNRESRNGDMSPGRAVGFKFGKIKNRHERPTLSKNHTSNDKTPNLRGSMKVRRSEDLEKVSDHKAKETPKFAHNKGGHGNSSGTMADLLKSNSEEVKHNEKKLSSNDDYDGVSLPKLNFKALIIAEQSDEGSDIDSKVKKSSNSKQSDQRREEANDSMTPIKDNPQATLKELYQQKEQKEPFLTKVKNDQTFGESGKKSESSKKGISIYLLLEQDDDSDSAEEQKQAFRERRDLSKFPK